MQIKWIYEHNKPQFAVGYDEYQWILGRNKRIRTDKNGEIEWQYKTYHPNLTSLFDELTEYYFKKNSKVISELKQLDDSVIKVYRLVASVSKKLEAQFKAVAGSGELD